jgi:hypothetical protein
MLERASTSAPATAVLVAAACVVARCLAAWPAAEPSRLLATKGRPKHQLRLTAPIFIMLMLLAVQIHN